MRPTQQRLSDVLHRGLTAARGGPLRSYPEYTWPFDTIPALVSLRLDGRHSNVMAAHHLGWLRTSGSDRWGLPFSRIEGDSAQQARGCAMSFQLCLMPHLDKHASQRLYHRYASRFWLDRGVIAGFAEFANGRQEMADIDSGPLVLGIGMSATGMGLGAAIAAKDQSRLDRLCHGLRNMEVIRPLLAQSQIEGIRIREQYFTGFLMGDAMIFYSSTWTNWPTQ